MVWSPIRVGKETTPPPRPTLGSVGPPAVDDSLPGHVFGKERTVALEPAVAPSFLCTAGFDL